MFVVQTSAEQCEQNTIRSKSRKQKFQVAPFDSYVMKILKTDFFLHCPSQKEAHSLPCVYVVKRKEEQRTRLEITRRSLLNLNGSGKWCSVTFINCGQNDHWLWGLQQRMPLSTWELIRDWNKVQCLLPTTACSPGIMQQTLTLTVESLPSRSWLCLPITLFLNQCSRLNTSSTMKDLNSFYNPKSWNLWLPWKIKHRNPGY